MKRDLRAVPGAAPRPILQSTRPTVPEDSGSDGSRVGGLLDHEEMASVLGEDPSRRSRGRPPYNEDAKRWRKERRKEIQPWVREILRRLEKLKGSRHRKESLPGDKKKVYDELEADFRSGRLRVSLAASAVATAESAANALELPKLQDPRSEESRFSLGNLIHLVFKAMRIPIREGASLVESITDDILLAMTKDLPSPKRGGRRRLRRTDSRTRKDDS